MSPRSVFTAHAVVAVAYAIPMLVVPASILAMHGMTAEPTAIGLARLLAASFAAFATVAWASRELPEAAARRVSAGFSVGLAIGAAVAAWNSLQAVGNAMGWTSVAVYGALAFAYARAASTRGASAGTRLHAG